MRICRNGITRAVLLIGPYAIKFPRWRYGWFKYLCGLRSNMIEWQFRDMADEYHLAPTIWHIPGGFMNVQRRCEPLSYEEWLAICCDNYCHPMDHEWYGMQSIDFKHDNFGTIDGRVVLLDYGELT